MNSIKNTIFKQRGLVKYFFRRNKKNNNTNDEDQNEHGDNNKDNKDNKKKESFFSFLKISQGIPMTKEDALKILNFTNKDELTSKEIIEKYEKFFIMNDPNKGGSPYLQNKIFNAKEFLMKDFPKEENNSKLNLDTNLAMFINNETKTKSEETKI